MNEKAIFVFTCNRPKKLESLFREISCLPIKKYKIYIIDDSCEREKIEQNKRFAIKYNNIHYLGRDQYLEFYEVCEGFRDYQILGDKTWNLGIARNFAMDYAVSLEHEKVLFLDDDISDINERKIEEGFSTVNKDCFVSCVLKGIEDDSVIGHISRRVGITDDKEKMLSGGFLFFLPNSISKRFYNIYNEDWIIQLLEKQKKRIVLQYTIKHNGVLTANWTLSQAIFQELGELVVEGLLENENALSMDYSFWDLIIGNRIKFIQEIRNMAIKINFLNGDKICRGLLKWLQQMDGYSLQQSIEQIKNEYNGYKI